MRFDIITLFPGFFSGPLDFGVLKRAQNEGRVSIATHDLRGYTHDRHRTVDDRPFGGGEGMVLKPEPIHEAITALGLAPRADRRGSRTSVTLLSAQGTTFTQTVAAELATLERVVLICGRYEGVDERGKRDALRSRTLDWRLRAFRGRTWSGGRDRRGDPSSAGGARQCGLHALLRALA